MQSIIITYVLFFTIIIPGIAQDKIVTGTNDTIECKITRSNEHFIYFRI